MRVIPVIHHKNLETSLVNAELAFSCDCDALFVISMHGNDNAAFETAKEIKNIYPNKLIGVNALTLKPIDALAKSHLLGLDMTWTDDTGIYKEGSNQPSLVKEYVEFVNKHSKHEFYGSFSFKYQVADNNPELTSSILTDYNMIPTTSGEATGVAADVNKIINISNFLKEKFGQYRLALASGLTPKNIKTYAQYITDAIVSTGISKDFYTFDENLLKEFIFNIKQNNNL